MLRLIRSGALAAALCLLPLLALAQTTLNPSDKSTHITLSGGNLTGTGDGSGGGDDLVRSTGSKTTGKTYFEGKMTANGIESGIGLCNATETLTNEIGASGNNSIGIYRSGHVFLNGSNVLSGPTFGNGDFVGEAVDFGAGKLWIRNNTAPTTWNLGGTADPATGVGGQSISAISGALFVCFDIPGSASAVATVNFGATSFNQSAPSGYSPWDSTGPPVTATGAALMGVFP